MHTHIKHMNKISQVLACSPSACALDILQEILLIKKNV